MRQIVLVRDDLPPPIQFLWFPTCVTLTGWAKSMGVEFPTPMCLRVTRPRHTLFVAVSGKIPRILATGLHIHECQHAADCLQAVTRRKADATAALSLSFARWLEYGAREGDLSAAETRHICRPLDDL